MDLEREYSPVLALTTKQSRKASWKKGLPLQEGLGRVTTDISGESQRDLEFGPLR